MAATIPEIEPKAIAAGSTATWTRYFADYLPTDGWVLSYALLKLETGQQILITSTTSGSNHLISVPASTTATYGAGEYNVQGYVTKAGERFNVWAGQIEVTPDFAGAAAGTDTRSTARKILDFIEASFVKIAQKQVVSTVIEGISLQFRSLKELTDARNYWLGEVTKEEAAIATNGGRRRSILAVFSKPI